MSSRQVKVTVVDSSVPVVMPRLVFPAGDPSKEEDWASTWEELLVFPL